MIYRCVYFVLFGGCCGCQLCFLLIAQCPRYVTFWRLEDVLSFPVSLSKRTLVSVGGESDRRAQHRHAITALLALRVVTTPPLARPGFYDI